MVCLTQVNIYLGPGVQLWLFENWRYNCRYSGKELVWRNFWQYMWWLEQGWAGCSWKVSQEWGPVSRTWWQIVEWSLIHLPHLLDQKMLCFMHDTALWIGAWGLLPDSNWSYSHSGEISVSHTHYLHDRIYLSDSVSQKTLNGTLRYPKVYVIQK